MNVLNFFATAIVFGVGSKLFSEHIQIQDLTTLLLATLFMFVIGWVFDKLLTLSVLLIPVGIGCLTIIPLILIAFVLTPIKLVLLNNYLDGFMIHGFWTYIGLTVALGIFKFSSSMK